MSEKFNSVEEYIENFPEKTANILYKIRKIILSSVPNVDENISYGMPAYKLKKKPLVYFAGYKNHIGLYAMPNAHAAFGAELQKYKRGKGSVQFPINEAIPFDLIEKIVLFNASVIMK